MSTDSQPDRRAQNAAFQAAFKEYKTARDEFDNRILSLVETGNATDAMLNALVTDYAEKHRRFIELSKPFVQWR